jgi:hypothetical protein
MDSRKIKRLSEENENENEYEHLHNFETDIFFGFQNEINGEREEVVVNTFTAAAQGN